MATEDKSGLVLHPRTRYNDDGRVHIEVEGIDMYVTPEMFQTADAQGELTVETFLAAPALEAMFDTKVEQDMDVEVRITPHEEEDD